MRAQFIARLESLESGGKHAGPPQLQDHALVALQHLVDVVALPAEKLASGLGAQHGLGESTLRDPGFDQARELALHEVGMQVGPQLF